ncbi:MAG: hypothetical protein ACO209_04335 [Aquirufa sp.]
MAALQLVLACHITGIYDVNRSTTLPDDSYELVQAWAESVAATKLKGVLFHNNFSEETCARYANEYISFVSMGTDAIFGCDFGSKPFHTSPLYRKSFFAFLRG